MPWLLNALYLTAIFLLSPLLLWSAWKRGKYRRGWRQKLIGELPQSADGHRPLWLHAVSVGEVKLLEPIVRGLLQHSPSLRLVITTTTDAGYELASTKYGTQHLVCYCPLDFSWAMRRAMTRVQPAAIVLAELEIWPNLVQVASELSIPVVVVNGRLSQRSCRRYRRVGWLLRKTFRQLRCVIVQNETYGANFRQLGVPEGAVHVAGSLKFDGAETDRQNKATRRLRELAGLGTNDRVVLFGSTQAEEEAMALDLLDRLDGRQHDAKLILVPRHPHRFDDVAAFLRTQHRPWIRRSTLANRRRSDSKQDWQILLVDTIGELGHWWGVADIGFVGGSFGSRGGQNMIEPAAYGVATCFGPSTENFREIVRLLLDADAARVVYDGTELYQFVRSCLEDESYRQRLSRNASRVVAFHRGAADRTTKLLLPLLSRKPRRAA